MSETTRDVELEALARETAGKIDDEAFSLTPDGFHLEIAERIILAALRRVQPEPSALEPVAKWMIAHGIATGHGDTLDDLLSTLWEAANEPSAEGPTEAQVKALKRYDLFGNIKPDGLYFHAPAVLALFAPPAADAEPEKEQP
jgi:hypothetical protein